MFVKRWQDEKIFDTPTLNSKLGWLTEWDGLDGWAGNICQSAQTSRLNSFLSVNFTFEKHFRNIGETFEKHLRNKLRLSTTIHRFPEHRQHCDTRSFLIGQKTILQKQANNWYKSISISISFLKHMVERIMVYWRYFSKSFLDLD